MPPSKSAAKGIGALTGGEVEIARLVSLREIDTEIGDSLSISHRTVSTHLSNIFVKTGVKSRAELADHVKAENFGC